MQGINDWAIEQIAGRTVKAVSDGKVGPMVNRVHTMRGVQHHRGYKGYVYVAFEGAKGYETFSTSFHQKPKAARAHADQIARAFRRQMKKQEA